MMLLWIRPEAYHLLKRKQESPKLKNTAAISQTSSPTEHTLYMYIHCLQIFFKVVISVHVDQCNDFFLTRSLLTECTCIPLLFTKACMYLANLLNRVRMPACDLMYYIIIFFTYTNFYSFTPGIKSWDISFFRRKHQWPSAQCPQASQIGTLLI